MQRTGTITRFDPERGFGFLHSPASPADVFFHIRDMDTRSGPPVVGMTVQFHEIHVGAKGPRAMAVRPLGRSAKAPAAGGADAQSRASRAARPRPKARGADQRSGAASVGPTAWTWLFWTGLALEAALLGWSIAHGRLPVVLVGGLLLLNLATVGLYWHDKHAAQRGAWRTPELHLHLMALAGGWPAAW